MKCSASVMFLCRLILLILLLSPAGALYAQEAAQITVEKSADGSGGPVTSQDLVAGSPLTMYAIARDAGGGFLGNVSATWSLQDSSGGVASSDLVPAPDGRSAQFTGHLVGTGVVRADSALVPAVPSGTITVIAGNATTLSVISGNGQTAEVTTTLPAPLVVRASDAYTNPVAGVGVTFTFTTVPTGAAGMILGTPTSDTGADGRASTTATLGDKSGTYVVTAFPAGWTASSVTFSETATPGAPKNILVEDAANGTGGILGPVTLNSGGSVRGYAIARDANGNFISNVAASTWAMIDVTGSVEQKDLVPATDNKSALFTADKVGTGRIQADAPSLKPTPSDVITVTPGSATRLAFGQQPTSTAAGAAITPAVTVRIEDNAGNLVTSGSRDVTMSIASNPSGGTLSGTTTVASSGGIATFSNLSINKPGSGYTLRANSPSLTQATSNAFDITTGAATTITLASGDNQSGTVMTQLPAPLVVTVTDAVGNPVSGVSVVFALDSQPSGASGAALTPTNTTTNSSGQASTLLKLGNRPGTYRVSATSTGLTGSPVLFNETAVVGSPTKLAFGQQPTSTAAGVDIAPPVTVRIEDEFGNLVTSGSRNVTMAIASNPSGGTLSGTTTVASSGGIATFNDLSINRTGSGYTLQATSTGLTGATSNAFNITTGAAATIVLASGDNQTGAVTTQLPSPLVVTVTDAAGNPVSGYSVAFAVDSLPSGATGASVNPSNPSTNSSGQASTTLTLGNRPGTYRVSATATGLTGSPVRFHATATVGSPTTLVFGQQPTSTAAGAAITPAVTVRIEDNAGNLVTSGSRDVTMSIASNPSGGTLSGTATAASSGGIATFNDLSIDRVGNGYTLRASSSGLTQAISASFNITTGSAARIALASGNNQTGAVATQVANPLVVTVTDAVGNPVPGYSVTFAVDSLPAGATGAAVNPSDATTNSSGQASTTLTLGNRPGTYRVSAAAAGLAGSPVLFRATATPGPAAELAFDQQPTNTTAGAPISPPVTVRIEDSYGNLVTTGSSNVTLAIASNPSGGTLSGTTTVASSAGVATFSNLSINRTGIGYTLRATSGTLTAATSSQFNISAGSAASIALTSGNEQTGTVGTTLANPLVVTVQDASGNPVTGVLVTFAADSVPPDAGGYGINPESMSTDGSGRASTTLTLGSRPGRYRVSATVTGLAGSPVQFYATATVGSAAVLELISGDGQSAPVGAPLGAPFVARVTDLFGNPVGGIGVTFALATVPQGATGAGLSVTSVQTDVQGLAGSTLTLGNKTGPYTVTASSTGLSGSPLTFTAAALPGPATQVRVETAPGGAGTLVGNRSIASGASLTVFAVARDAFDNFVSDTAANPFTGWTLEAITGGVHPTDLVPGQDNTSATFTGHLLGSAIIRAAVTGLTSVPTDTIHVATGGTPAVVSVETAPSGLGTPVPPRTLTSGDTLRVFAVFRDAAGNFLGNSPADGWSLTNTVGGVAAGDLVPSADRRSALFSAHVAGSGVIAATSGTLDTLNSGLITVVPGAPATVSVRAGDTQSTTVGAPFDSNLVALVRDLSGNPVSGAAVRFAAPASGPSGTFAPGARSIVVNTGPNGLATAPAFTANTLAGTYADTARVAGVPASALFTLTNRAGAPDTLLAVDGTPQTARVSTAFAVNFSVAVRDQYGNPIPGVLVRFAAPDAGASGTFAAGRDTARTDVNGIAVAAVFVANITAGSYHVSASVPGLPLTPALFSLTNTAGPVGKILAVEGDSQSAQVNTAFAVRFKARVLDAADNPVRGALVTFRAPVTTTGPTGSFGSGATDTARTDAAGEVVAAAFNANTRAGSYTVNATVEGAAAPAAFRLTNAAAGLDTFLVEAAGGGPIGPRVATEPFPIRVTAQDAYGNTVTSFAGTVDISANIALLQGGGRSRAFSGGVLDDDTVALARSGNATITVQRTGGLETGRSATFSVSNPVPTIVSVAPANARAGEALDVVITGSGFITGATTVTFGDRISTTTVVNSPTRVTVSLRIDAAAPPGPRNVTVINVPPGGGTAIQVNGFTIGDNPVPSLASVQPDSGTQGQTLVVVLRGTNFLGGVSTASFGSGITVNSAVVDSSTRMVANISIDGAATTGTRNVSVTNGPPGGGTSGTVVFTVRGAALAAPVPVTPADGARNQPTSLTLRWRRAVAAQSYWLQVGGNTFFADSVLVVNDSLITDTLRQVGPLDALKAYYWRVRARNASGYSNWSAVWSFTPSYPASITVSASVPFPTHASASDYQASDYRIVGLPGASDTLLTALLPGSPGTDWQAYWDNGDSANYLKEFSAADTMFRFATGRAFWLIKKGAWNVSATLRTALHDSVDNVSIPLHAGWNLIANPHPVPLNWSTVQAANGNVSEPIWAFQGSFTQPPTFTSEAGYGYYFLNRGNLRSLKVPSGNGGMQKRAMPDSSGWRIHVRLEWDNHVDRTTEIGVVPGASAGLDRLDFHKPRAPGAMPGIFFSRPDWDPQFSNFASDIRPSVDSLARWELTVTSPAGKPLRLAFEGVGSVPAEYDVRLIDGQQGRSVDLRSLGAAAYPFVSPGVSRITLLVGTHDAVARESEVVLPKEFALGMNFPNPFNPSTTIPVAVPRAAQLSLIVYSLLGQEVATLHNGPLEPGRYWFTWDGNNDRGSFVATGVYIVRMTTDTGIQFVRKMLLMK